MAAILQCAQCRKFYKGKTGLSSHAKNTGHDVDFPGGNANLESTPVAPALDASPNITTPVLAGKYQDSLNIVMFLMTFC